MRLLCRALVLSLCQSIINTDIKSERDTIIVAMNYSFFQILPSVTKSLHTASCLIVEHATNQERSQQGVFPQPLEESSESLIFFFDFASSPHGL